MRASFKPIPYSQWHATLEAGPKTSKRQRQIDKENLERIKRECEIAMWGEEGRPQPTKEKKWNLKAASVGCLCSLCKSA
jgi:hypothetical protein